MPRIAAAILANTRNLISSREAKVSCVYSLSAARHGVGRSPIMELGVGLHILISGCVCRVLANLCGQTVNVSWSSMTRQY